MESKKQAVRENYDKTAGIYDSRYKEIQEEKYRIMLEDLQLKEPILDLGSGTGLLQKFLKGTLYGLDISFASLKKSKELSVQGDAESLPFKDNSFATVLSFTTAQNLDSVENMLREIARVLKSNGIAVITILAKFRNKLSAVEKYFRIIEIKTCGEDIGLVLSANK
jgi:ubiquinone/menaquinone biosynthesis C-methylase UbiE